MDFFKCSQTIILAFFFVMVAFTSGMVFVVAERNKYLGWTNTTQWGNSTNGTNKNLTNIGYTKMMVNLLWGFYEPRKPGEKLSSAKILRKYQVLTKLLFLIETNFFAINQKHNNYTYWQGVSLDQFCPTQCMKAFLST